MEFRSLTGHRRRQLLRLWTYVTSIEPMRLKMCVQTRATGSMQAGTIPSPDGRHVLPVPAMGCSALLPISVSVIMWH
eukprot:scaffold603_cov404-Prasinococcus_capsulatus_cf.AAC.57